MPIVNPNIAVDPGNSPIQQNSYAFENGIAPQYQIILSVSGDSKLAAEGIFPIIAAMPERYTMNLSSQWDTPFANKTMGDAAGDGATLVNTAISALGIGTRNQYQLAQVWQSTAPLSFSIDFIFNAKTNTQMDIRNKHLALFKLVSPTLGFGGMLSAPGPSPLDKAVGGRNIKLQLGTYLVLENMIVKSVSADVQTMCGADGIPHAVTMNVEFETYYAGMTTDAFDQIFRVGL